MYEFCSETIMNVAFKAQAVFRCGRKKTGAVERDTAALWLSTIVHMVAHNAVPTLKKI